MSSADRSWEQIVRDLNERAKELRCLYGVEEALQEVDGDVAFALSKVAETIPAGWQFSQLCRARVRLGGEQYVSGAFAESPWCQRAPVVVDGSEAGAVEVYYLEEVVPRDRGLFLPEEQRLLDTIAERIGHFLYSRRLRSDLDDWRARQVQLETARTREWEIVLGLLERTDRTLFLKISRKMINYLCWIGIEDAKLLLQSASVSGSLQAAEALADSNKPSRRRDFAPAGELAQRIFAVARAHLSDGEILENIQKWIRENRVGFLVRTLENLDNSLADIFDAVSRFHHLAEDEVEMTPYTRQNVAVLLIHRLFTGQLDFIRVARDYIDVHQIYDVLRTTIAPKDSHGLLGGKSAGLFLAGQILRRRAEENPAMSRVRIPRTWYITSDCIQTFLNYNDLEEMLEQKYKSVEQIREEYPNIVQILKNSVFPGEILTWLSGCLDDLGVAPIIVRSSSLLEDRTGTAFSGKYKSLFLANGGTREERLNALTDAIAEVYASVFAPDPIEYRRERGLTDFHEEMGIMIQEVVGRKMGRYFLPECAGVAMSNNELRWSPRLRREDGLVRLVPGLGTRAVDRLSDDYPRLLAPGQPGLNVNATVEETLHYAPRWVDVIDLEKNSFVTVPVGRLLAECGESFPGIENIVSVHRDGALSQHSRIDIDFQADELVVTFDGLIRNTPFVKDIQALLRTLSESLGKPVDIEFAVSGGQIYLLQCRGQSSPADERPLPIPDDVERDDVLFHARKQSTNGWVPDITHLVYVVPEAYAALPGPEEMARVARAVGRLNSLLPKRQFILIGPGRWGSRGDVRLGVPVTYSEINNCAVLAEVARRSGPYSPDLSFGTHFFQDLVEASIRYIPLYPDEPGDALNERFILDAENLLPHLLPEHAGLAEVIRVVDFGRAAGGRVVRVSMSSETGEALAWLDAPGDDGAQPPAPPAVPPRRGEYWRWRMRAAERIAARLDPQRFGVKAMYVFGSTKNGTAGPASDIDLLLHFQGTEEQKGDLLAWLEGWSLSLAELNYMRTGLQTDGLLDVKLVTDEDIARRSSYAVKIGAVTDPAEPLALRS